MATCKLSRCCYCLAKSSQSGLEAAVDPMFDALGLHGHRILRQELPEWVQLAIKYLRKVVK